jgi:hypothetical protein
VEHHIGDVDIDSCKQIQMSLNVLQCQRQFVWKIDNHFTMLSILWVSCFVRQNQYEFLYMAVLDRSRAASKIPFQGIGQQIQQKQLEAEFAVIKQLVQYFPFSATYGKIYE